MSSCRSSCASSTKSSATAVTRRMSPKWSATWSARAPTKRLQGRLRRQERLDLGCRTRRRRFPARRRRVCPGQGAQAERGLRRRLVRQRARTYRINIEGLAKLIRDYLATKPAGHRIVFLVDEVGQFIGDNTQLMLTLQTITEQLGTLCQGRAWVIVTSQEDIDAAIGEANKAKSQDFSKIQGRFHTRLSLASSNTDEVIGERLLAKTEAAHVALRDRFEKKGDIINNQLAFVGNSVTMKSYKDAAEFVACYPFAPYQFALLQKIFESIRKVGATGKHLSKGERSLLDAFQSAAVRNADRGSTRWSRSTTSTPRSRASSTPRPSARSTKRRATLRSSPTTSICSRRCS
jgi:hypothetical protein